ncbi:MAG: polysaccharide biosynthesis protein CapD [Schlesneria sp.]|nr:polysaccharide biosynthesis protein CapD [Schlesneria sp.]
MRFRLIAALPVYLTLYTVSLTVAFLLRFDLRLSAETWRTLFAVLPFTLLIKTIVFVFGREWNRYHRYTTMSDLAYIIGLRTIGSLLVFSFFTTGISDVVPPRSVMAIDWVLSVLGTIVLRASIRYVREQYGLQMRKCERKRTLVYGADINAVSIVRLLRSTAADHEIVAFLDPFDSAEHTLIGGIPVVNFCDDIAGAAAKYKAGHLFIPGSVSGRTVRGLYQYCQDAGVKAHVIPAISEIVSGRVKLSISDVTISDLLRREPTQLDMEGIAGFIAEKVVLVTGAAGSIGSELCRQIIEFNPTKVVLVDQSEFGMFQIEQGFVVQDLKGVELVYVIADVNDQPTLSRVFSEHQPDMVFHAAAYKHVPLMEDNPQIAIRNNVLGTKSVVDLADRFGVQHFVLISTDKAVRPTSIMGSTKLVAEKYLQAVAATSKTKFITVRFGNVLNSAGSVVPTFRRQILEGGPVTVTHPDMTRFFMTIPEAVQLVLQASALGDSGQVLILDMGEPVKILDLARDMISLSGLRYPDDIDIEFTGLRPGEKMYEELFYGNEKRAQKVHAKIFCAEREPISLLAIKQNISRLERASQGNRADARKTLGDVIAGFIAEGAEFDRQAA